MTHKASILIVDDNRDAADLLGEALSTLGYEVCVVHSARAALDVTLERIPDAALLDIGLPEIDGYELGAKLLARRPDICLVAITGYGQANDRERALAAGFAAHLVKPVPIMELVKTIEEHCNPRVASNTPSVG